MTFDLEQEDSIKILSKIEFQKDGRDYKIVKNQNETMVTREYCVDCNKTEYPTANKLVIQYKMNKYTGKVKEYTVFLTNELGDVIHLCNYSPNVINTLFNNIILLELSNWRRVTEGLTPFKYISDFTSYMFEVKKTTSKKFIGVLQRLIDKNSSSFFESFKKYGNTNEIISSEIWENQLSNFGI